MRATTYEQPDSEIFTTTRLIDPTTARRFARRVRIIPNLCWIWVGAIESAHGYSRFWFGPTRPPGESIVAAAHRVAYIATNGPIPTSHVIRHRCDVRLCVRPDHLDHGTIADNNADRSRRHRTPVLGAPANRHTQRSRQLRHATLHNDTTTVISLLAPQLALPLHD